MERLAIEVASALELNILRLIHTIFKRNFDWEVAERLQCIGRCVLHSCILFLFIFVNKQLW